MLGLPLGTVKWRMAEARRVLRDKLVRLGFGDAIVNLQPETLDETIDRVAAALTAVPADPGFSARVAPRLDAPARGGSAWMVAAAAAAAIVLAVILARPERQAQMPVQQTAATAATAPQAAAVPPVATASPATPVASVAPLRVAAPLEEVHEPAAPASAIAALAPVETMNVDDLTLHDLHIAPVAVAHLDIEELDVPQIGTAEELAHEPKE